MVRRHRRLLGAPIRRDYDLASLEGALEAVICQGYSFGQAAEEWGVPKTTIYRRYMGQNSEFLGKPAVLNRNEEAHIVNALTAAANYGYPFTELDLREFVQQYLHKKGVIIKCFKDNRPGKEWCRAFLQRNKTLSVRMSENMKRNRAELSKKILEEYFAELKISLDGVSPDNIINYDETNLTDDPGKQRVLVRRGSKHATRVLDASKSSTSIMFACSGDGILLPPYVIYKAKNLYPEWIEGGPDGACYNRTPSGWFDRDTFEDWFTQIVLPYFKRKEGKKILIGDNLASHLSLHVIRKCTENNIGLVFLPPHSTHICQPLDVSVFRPMKIAWRKVLTQWKLRHKGVLPKTQFPSQLKKMLSVLQTNLKENILAGFASTGIFPWNPQKVLSKILTVDRNKPNQPEVGQLLLNSFADIVEKNTRKEENQQVKRRKKITVPSGRSVTENDIEVDRLTAGPSGKRSVKRSTEPQVGSSNAKKKYVISDDEESDNAIEDVEMDSGDNMNNSETDEEPKLTEPENCDQNIKLNCDNIKADSFVTVKYIYNRNTKKETAKYFVAKVIDCDVDNKRCLVSCLRVYKDKKHCFVFPNVEDINYVAFSQITSVLPQPNINRGKYIFPDNIIGI